MVILQIVLISLLALSLGSAALSVSLHQKWYHIMRPLFKLVMHDRFDNLPLPGAAIWVDLLLAVDYYGSMLWHFAVLFLTPMAGFMVYQKVDFLRISFAVIMLVLIGYDTWHNVRPMYKHFQIKDYYVDKWNQKYPDLAVKKEDDKDA